MGLFGHVIVGLIIGLVVGCNGRPPEAGSRRTPEGRLLTAKQDLANAANELERFYALNDAAKQSFVVGKTVDARKYAEELRDLYPTYKGDWNYGNAVQDANQVLGRIALAEGRVDEAKEYLLKSGRGPGSPQMNSFGPNMSLAKDLLEKGERQVVLEYFSLCRGFWLDRDERLDEWSVEVSAGKIPDFGANLVY